MEHFERQGSELVIGGWPLSRLTERVGQTPFYAYDRRQITARIAAVRQCLPPGVGLHYAVKANPMPALLAHLCPQVDGMDVASGGELKLALDAGAAPATIGFAGPGKREAELRQAVAAGVLLHVESARELAQLVEIAQAQGRAARVALRLNPDFEWRGAGMRMGGGAKPFGVDVEQAPALLHAMGQAGLAFEGFHLYAGSQCLQAQLLADGLHQALELVLRLAPHAPQPIRYLNFGGGWGIPYFPGEVALALPPIAQALGQVQQRLARELPGARLVLELGRYLVGEAGVYVARVLERKLSRGQVFVVTDGGLHQHLAATGHLGQVLRRNYPVVIGNRLGAPEREQASVVGPLCTPLDMLAERIELALAQPGDWVVVFQSGAYGASASPQAFLGHPPCPEVLV